MKKRRREYRKRHNTTITIEELALIDDTNSPCQIAPYGQETFNMMYPPVVRPAQKDPYREPFYVVNGKPPQAPPPRRKKRAKKRKSGPQPKRKRLKKEDHEDKDDDHEDKDDADGEVPTISQIPYKHF